MIFKMIWIDAAKQRRSAAGRSPVAVKHEYHGTREDHDTYRNHEGSCRAKHGYIGPIARRGYGFHGHRRAIIMDCAELM